MTTALLALVFAAGLLALAWWLAFDCDEPEEVKP